MDNSKAAKKGGCLCITPELKCDKQAAKSANPQDHNTPSGQNDYMTLNRLLIRRQRLKHGTGELSQLLISVQTAIKAISYAIREAGITELFGLEGTMNVQGEEVKKLDKVANEIFINIVKSSFATCIMVSEENDEIIEVEEEHRGKYMICFDPLDGSSNIDCAVTIGSIFGVYKQQDDKEATPQDILQPGKNLVAAGYAVYGSSTLLVLSTGEGVDIFMLDPSIGEFLMIDSQIKIPAKGEIYSINEAYEAKWDDAIKEYIKNRKDPSKGKSGARYVGSMVADMHRTLKYGGIFMYPPTKDAPKGKLRLLYECIPMAFIITQAGGLATNGDVNILDIVPEAIHQRSPIYIGSKDDVTALQEVINSHK